MKYLKYALLPLMAVSTVASAGQWSAGPVAIQQASPYLGGDSGFMLFPGVAYQGEKFVLYGPQADYFVYGDANSDFRIAATIALGPNQLEVDDDLRLAGIEDRDSGFLGGVRVDYGLFGGTASLGLQTDLTDESDGQRIVASWQKSLFNSDPAKWNVTAGVQLEWTSDDYVNYYYGVTEEEAARSAFDFYEVDSVVMPSLTVGGYYNINEKWQVIYNAQYQVLDSDIEDSPIVDQSSALSGILGFVYLF